MPDAAPQSSSPDATTTPTKQDSSPTDGTKAFPDWAKDASGPATSSTVHGQPPLTVAGRRATDASTTTDATSQPAPRWPWLVVIALLAVLLAYSATLRKTERLEDETERLSRRERVLQTAHRDLQNQSEQLRHLAINDPLTGVLNRQAFANELRALLDHLSRFNRPLNLMVFDLDHFKAINDRQGHLAGDSALKLVAGVVRKHLNSEDLFGRFGGDEFLIACADQTLDETAATADLIRCDVGVEALTCNPPLEHLSLSIGIAQANPESGYHLDDLFHSADTALYTAKREGRNRVVLASESLPAPPASATVARNLA